jgi:hypothetical protein
MHILHYRTLAFIVLIILSGTASAAELKWSTLGLDPQTPSDDRILNASGSMIDNALASSGPLGNFTFELGSFNTSGGWTPSINNVNEWASRWKLFGRSDQANGEWNPTTQKLLAIETFNSNGTSSDPASTATFSDGEILYLWLYNTKNLITGAEWSLFRDGSGLGSGDPGDDPWVMPLASDEEILDMDPFFADQVIVGAINGINGAGTYTPQTYIPNSMQIQTAIIPIPEPSSACFLMLSAALSLLPRKRRMSH